MYRHSNFLILLTTLTFLLPSTVHGFSFNSVAVAATGVDSDFNGDGYEDLAIGVPLEDRSAGAVNVLYGTSSGLQTSPADQFWTQNSAGIEDTAEQGDKFGETLAYGDFNNDGFSDLAIGAPEETIGSEAEAGAVHILYGSASGLQASSPPDQLWNQNSPSIDSSPKRIEFFGCSLATGDFNNDGYHDLAIGVRGQSIQVEAEGAAHVLYGSPSGLQTSSPADQFWHQDKPGVDQETDQADAFGSSLAAADFNNDGYDDLVIGVPQEMFNQLEDYAGGVHILFGSSSGLQTSSPADQFWHQDSPGVDNTRESNDGFGASLAAGDFNNDGYDDLVIGVPAEGLDGIEGVGVVHVLYGSNAGPQTSSPRDQLWHQNSPGVEGREIEGDAIGSSGATGDFNDDGFDDLVIGVPRERDNNADPLFGAVHVLYGSSTGLRSSPAADGTGRTDQFWHQDSPGIPDSSEGADQFGHAVTSGDFNDDGFSDLAIGVPREGLGDVEVAGVVHVIYGSAQGLQTSAPADQFWHQNSPGVEDSVESGDAFGSALA